MSDKVFGKAPGLVLNHSQQAIEELAKKGPLTRRMLIVAVANIIAMQLPLDDSIAVMNAGPAAFVQTARQPLKAAGLSLHDDDLREAFGQACYFLSGRVRAAGKVPKPRLVM